MNVKILLRVVPAVALICGAIACDDGLTEVNRNPNQPEVVPLENLLAGGIWDVVANAGNRGAFGYWTQFYHTELWVQHLAQSAYNDEDHYVPREGVNENIWSEMYAALLDLKRVKDRATEEGDQEIWAAAEVTSIYGFLVLTDLFGDIPYSEALALEDGIQNPKYDSQATIYPDLLARLEAVAATIDPAADASFSAGDLLYGGDMEGWLEFANSLRLRVAMRIADTELSSEARDAFVSAWAADKFDDVEDAADLDWSGAQPAQNPVFENIVLAGRSGDFRVSATLVDTLDSLNDPRLPIFANPATATGEIRGLPNGNEPADLDLTVNHFSTIGDAFVAPDAPSVLMSYAEVLLLGAEAAERGWIAADAEQLYREGIEASMEQFGVGATATATYLAQPSVAYKGLESIWLQKWIALYLAGPEAYTEWRRTRVPMLTISDAAVEDEIPSRIPYPSDEGLYNPENFKPYENVVLTDELWWMAR